MSGTEALVGERPSWSRLSAAASHVCWWAARGRPSGSEFGGMLSFELRDPDQADAVLAGFRLVMPALSLGGVESLVCVPSRTSHRKLSREERARAGISDGLVRVSVGVEDIEDLIDDFTRALEVVGCC